MTKLVSAIGGVLLIASFFLPLVDTKGAGADDLFRISSMRAEIERSREFDGAAALIEPALKQLEVFAAGPSLLNLAGAIGATTEILDTIARAGALPSDARQASTALTAVRWSLWLVPLVGAVQAALPLLARFRRYAGFFGLVGRFGFGLLFVVLALTPMLGAPEATRALLGPAVYAALIGGAMMMVGGVFGVTRGNFIPVFVAEAGLVAALVMGISALV